MAKLSLLYGPAHPDKSQTLFRTCLERIGQQREDSFFYLVPSRRQASYLRQKILAECGKDLLLDPKILGLEDFARHLYRLLPERRTLLSTAGLRLLLDDVLHHRSASLTSLRNPRGEWFSGFSSALVPFLQELRAADICPQALDARRHELAGLAGKRGAEVIQIYRDAIQGMGSHYIDYNGAFHAITKDLDAQRLSAQLPQIDLLLISGFAAFEPPLKGLLERLFSLIAETHIAIDFVPTRAQLFRSSESAFAWLEARATQTIDFTPPSTNTPLNHLDSQLFSAANPAPAAKIQTHPCSNRPEEVRKIARLLRCMGSAGVVETGQIRVLCPNPDLYAPLFQEIFPRYGLPLHLSRGFPLSRSPVVIAILAILDTVLDRYGRTTLLRLLKLPYFRFEFKAAGEKHYLEAAAVDRRTRNLPQASGAAQWLDIIDSRCAQLESELAGMRRGDLFADELEDPDRWLQKRAEERDQLLLLRQGFEALFHTLAPLEKSLDMLAFRQHLHEILERFGLFSILLPSQPITWDRSQITRDLRAYERFLEVVDELAGLAPLLKRKALPLAHLAATLRTTIAQSYYHPARSDNRGILIAPLEEGRWLSCDQLFVCGLVEGDFPRPALADIFLDDGDRRTLGLAPAESRIEADRLLFYQVLSQARQEIHLLFPQDQNADSTPSSFLSEVQSHINTPKKGEMAPEMLTLADLHAFMGRALCQPPKDPMACKATELARQCRELPAFAPALERLLQGLAITDQRTRLHPPGPSEGNLDHPEALEFLNRRFGPAHAFSITQLESYARCPFLFFAEKVLGIQPLTDPAEDYYALDRGNLIHRTLYNFYSERRRKGRMERVRLDNLSPALERLHQIARREAQNLGLRGFFWEMELERMLGTKSGEECIGLLPRFLELEARELEATTPAHFELSFGAYPGMGPGDPHSTPQPLLIKDPESGTQARIQGKIDRIDRTPEGKFVVLDYKTGAISDSLSAILEGRSLQLPIYLLAIEDLLGAAGMNEGVAGAYYELRDHEHCGKTGLFANESHKGQVYRTHSKMMDHEAFRAALAQTRDFALTYVRNIQQGRFHVTTHPVDKACNHCSFQQSCRLDPRRMQLLKRQGQLS